MNNRMKYSWLVVVIMCLVVGHINSQNSCKQQSDCSSSSYRCIGGQCKTKSILDGFNWQDGLYLILVFTISCLAAVSGIGGGVLFVPLMLFILQFQSIDSVATSSVLVFFGQTIKVLVGFKSRHPLANRPVVDWQVITVVIAPLLVGTLFGVLFQVILPVWIVMIIFVIVIGITFIKTIKKALQARATEKMQLIQQQNNKNNNNDKNDNEETDVMKNEQNIQLQVIPDKKQSLEIEGKEEEKEERKEEDEKLVNNNNDNNNMQTEVNQNKNLLKNKDEEQKIVERAENKELELILQKESINVPYVKLMYLLLQLIVMFLLKVLGGSKSKASVVGVQSCSGVYWVLQVLYLPIALVCSLWLGIKVVQEYQLKQRLDYPFKPGDIQYTDMKKVAKMNGIGTFAGTAAAMFGIGGGVLVSPIFMSLFQMNIMVSNFTVSVMSASSAASSLLQYMLYGKLNLTYSLFGAVVSVAGSFFGSYYVLAIIKKKNKQSYIVFTLAAAILLSAVLSLIKGITSFINDLNAGKAFHFKFDQIC